MRILNFDALSDYSPKSTVQFTSPLTVFECLFSHTFASIGYYPSFPQLSIFAGAVGEGNISLFFKDLCLLYY